MFHLFCDERGKLSIIRTASMGRDGGRPRLWGRTYEKQRARRGSMETISTETRKMSSDLWVQYGRWMEENERSRGTI